MDVQTLDPDDDEDVALWAAQLAVPQEALREAVAAIGTDVDKIRTWLLVHRAADAPGQGG
ncbi:hypothetical protein CLD22_21790 [Rubrivivax gelatinosus]|nr:hypothetical protein [Rubrivivax gelatinosus]